jgi:hypothetical protein
MNFPRDYNMQGAQSGNSAIIKCIIRDRLWQFSFTFNCISITYNDVANFRDFEFHVLLT